MTDEVARPPPAAPSDRCAKHDFPLDSAGCALCRQEAAGAAYAPGAAPLPPATIGGTGGGRRDPAVWIIGGALTFAGCVMPLAIGGVSALLAWLLLGTTVKMTLGIALGAALLTLVGVFSSK